MENTEKKDFESFLTDIMHIASSFSTELSECIGNVNPLSMHIKAAVLEEYLEELKADSNFDVRFYEALLTALRQSSEITVRCMHDGLTTKVTKTHL